MKKKNFYFLLMLAVICFLPNSVFAAKQLELTCTYNINRHQPNLESMDVSDHVVTDFVKYECQFYDDNSHKCVAYKENGKTNNDNLVNTNDMNVKNWYKDNKKCVPYVVFVDSNTISFSAYKTKNEAESYYTNRLTFYRETYLLQNPISQKVGEQPNNPNAGKTDKDLAREEYNNYINYLSDFGNKSHLEEYCDKNGKGVYEVATKGLKQYKSSLCRDTKVAQFDLLQTWDKNVREWLNKNYITESEYNKYQNLAVSALKSLGKTSLNPNNDQVESEVRDVIHRTTKKANTDTPLGCILFGPNVLKDLQNILKIIQIVGPLLCIGFSVYEAIKAVTKVDAEAEFKKLYQRFLKRFVYTVLLFFIPLLVSAFFNLIEDNMSDMCEIQASESLDG